MNKFTLLSILGLFLFCIECNAQCYLVEGPYQTTTAFATLQEKTTGVYEGTVTFKERWFAVVTALTTTENDWEEFNKHRYCGPTSYDYELPLSEEVSIQKMNDTNMGASFVVPAVGEYTITVDFNNMTIKATSESVEEMPSEIYIIGNDGVWNPNEPGATLTKAGDWIYEGKVSFTSNWFTIYKKLDGSWNTPNRYGPEYDSKDVELGTTMEMYSNYATSWKIETGEYDVKVNLMLRQLTVSATSTGITSLDKESPIASRFYDLYGRNMRKMPQQKGIYITNGKKFVLR